MNNILKISPNDNVGVALSGEKKGHKTALCDIKKGQEVIKYGYPIGKAVCDIKKDGHVHTHNLKTALGDILEYHYQPNIDELPSAEEDFFSGYLREDGQVGIRNEIWIIPTVGCISGVASKIAAEASAHIAGSCDGVYAFPHPFGCSQLGDDHENTKKLLAALASHPNAAGVLILGLGCENNRISGLAEAMGSYDSKRVRFLECQDIEDEIKTGVDIVKELIDGACSLTRVKVPVSKLVVGLKCGGSDGLSGITANPLTGCFSDLLVAAGGSTVLTEVPEMFGAETILMNRCINANVFDKTVSMINSFKEYYKQNNQPIYENPSPGNKDGGITTLEEKSLGCTQKSGRAPVCDVLGYADKSEKKGLNLLYAPGNDLVAATALAAAGAQIVLFTTGRGTPFGCPVPTLKLSTNTELYTKKTAWMDMDAGVLLDGVPMEQLARTLYDTVKEIASGNQKTKNELNGYREIAIFKTGVTL